MSKPAGSTVAQKKGWGKEELGTRSRPQTWGGEQRRDKRLPPSDRQGGVDQYSTEGKGKMVTTWTVASVVIFQRKGWKLQRTGGWEEKEPRTECTRRHKTDETKFWAWACTPWMRAAGGEGGEQQKNLLRRNEKKISNRK